GQRRRGDDPGRPGSRLSLAGNPPVRAPGRWLTTRVMPPWAGFPACHFGSSDQSHHYFGSRITVTPSIRTFSPNGEKILVNSSCALTFSTSIPYLSGASKSIPSDSSDCSRYWNSTPFSSNSRINVRAEPLRNWSENVRLASGAGPPVLGRAGFFP